MFCYKFNWFFTIRNFNEVTAELVYNALPEDFSAVPSHTFMNSDINDDLNYFTACKYINETYEERAFDDSVYSDYDYLVDAVREPVKIALNLT